MFVRRLALIFALLAALVGTQLPEYAQQYRQRLGGALDELTAALTIFSDEAAAQALTTDSAIDRLKANPDPLARQRGLAVESEVIRRARLADSLEAMRDAGPVARLEVMVADFDPAVGAGALAAFEPALPLGREGWIIGAFFFAAGWIATLLAAWPVRRMLARRRMVQAMRVAAR